MEDHLDITNFGYKDIEEYKLLIDNVIEGMLSKNERLIFAVAAEKAGVDPYVIRKYPELRRYILQKIMYYKEIQVINQKIDRAVMSLIKSNKPLTFISIANKCKFSGNSLYQNQYIKEKIRCAIARRWSYRDNWRNKADHYKKLC